jgi:hypothetical protein
MLDRKAYQGAPAGYPRSDFPDGRFILHPSQWDKNHWSFDEELKTRGKSVHQPMTADEALNLIKQMMSATQSVGK